MLKLLDYGKLDSFAGIIGRQRNLAWPVNVYRVTLPRVSDDGGLNVFERVVLKLLEAVGLMDADALANETRIPLDLTKCILLRLQDKGLIDGNHSIIEQKRNDEETPAFVTALLFRELVTGKVLPFLHWLDDSNPMLKKEGEEKDFQIIRWDATRRKEMPDARNVLSALRAMQKRSSAFGRNQIMPAIQQITIVAAPELLHLDCPIAIQKSDGEFRIADPFGNGFSLILENAFQRLLEQDESLAKWLGDWKQALSNPRPEKQEITPKEPYDNDSNRQRFPKLIANLRPSLHSPFRSIAQIHAVIEWALFYSCYRRPVESFITRLKLTAQEQHPELLERAAKTIGLELPSREFRPIRLGKLRDFEEGSAYQETVLAIAMLQAQDDASHPLRRLALSHPDLIHRLFVINNKRNEKMHGKGGTTFPQQELPDEPFMREVVHTLVPDITFAHTPVAAPSKDAIGDALLDARASIQAELGHKLYNHLGSNLQDRLVYAELFFLSCQDEDDAMAYVNDLYAAVQAAFQRALIGKLPPDVNDTQLRDMTEAKAIEAGFCTALPESLRTVKTSAVRKTLQGESQTLGACLLAWLLAADTDELAEVHDVQPFLLVDTANLINLRLHGNEPVPLPKMEVVKLRKKALSTIKTLIEQ